MKRKTVVGIALMLGMLVTGSAHAAGCAMCGEVGKCKDPLAVQQFRNETAPLSTELKAKDGELRSLYATDSIDTNRAEALEAEIKEIKAKIHAVSDRLSIPPCCTV